MPLLEADPARLRQALYAGLSAALGDLVRAAAAAAAARGTPLYLAGGAVRDLLLGRPPLDLDLMLAGDAITLAQQVAAPRHLRVRAHTAFGTATIELPAGLAPPPPAPPTLDFVTARRETYAAPAVLPTVTPADLPADLARRDFTINALALALDPADAALHDPFGGLADLAAGRIRVLHAASFVDDPTRIFRAVRYAARFGFTIEPATLAAIGSTIRQGLLSRLSPARVRHELERTLAEPDPAPALAHLARLGVPAALDPAWTWDAAPARALGCAPDPEARLYLLVAHCPPNAQVRLATRLGLPSRPLAHLTRLDSLAAALPAAAPSRAAALLRPLDPRSLALARCLAAPPLAAVLARYQTTWQHVTPLLTGADLRAHGIPPGPRYRVLLEALRDARLDGRVTTRDDEVALLDGLMRDEG